MNKKFNFVLIYKFLINGSLMVVFDVYVLANINFIYKESIKKVNQSTEGVLERIAKTKWIKCVLTPK